MGTRDEIKKLQDSELIERYRSTGDNAYAGELFTRYTRFVFFVCMKYFKDEEKCKDASITIFEKLLTELKKSDIRNFKAWLHTVTKNHCLIELRTEKYQLRKTEELKKDATVFMESDYEMCLDVETGKEAKLNDLEDAVKSLNEEQRQCVELFYLQEKSYNEVADITGFTMNQVKSYIQNGKRNLKIYLLDKNER